MGGMGGMGAMGWLGGCSYTDTTAFHFLVQGFSACWKMGKVLFFVRSRPVAQKGTFLFSDVTDWSRLWKWKNTFSVPHWSRTNENNVLSHSSTCRESLNEKVMKCSCVCVIVFTQSAHGTHSAQLPICGGSGPGCCSGAAYGSENFFYRNLKKF